MPWEHRGGLGKLTGSYDWKISMPCSEKRRTVTVTARIMAVAAYAMLPACVGALELYPTSPVHRSDAKLRCAVNGQPVALEHFRTSESYYFDTSYAWFAADGPVEVELSIDAPVTKALLRTVRKDLPLKRNDSTLSFALPGPGHYYLQLPELGQPKPGSPDSGTYTVLFLIDDLKACRSRQMDPAAADVTNVAGHGILSDAKKDQTQAVQTVASRGGNIYFPLGIYRVRNLKVPSNTTIYLAAGAIIQGADGDAISNGVPFLDLRGAERVRVYGPGTIDGNGQPYHLVQTENSQDITLEDVLFRNCTSWAIHLLLVDKVVCRHLRVLSGKDGIDPDCAKDVTIEHCCVLAKDDAIVIKTRKPPATTERVTVCHCIVASDASALKIGTETRALVRDVIFEDCEVFDSDRGIIMYARDGGPIEDVTWRNIRMHLIHWPHETGGAPFQFLITKRGGGDAREGLPRRRNRDKLSGFLRAFRAGTIAAQRHQVPEHHAACRTPENREANPSFLSRRLR
jgi:hypothetical protein